MKLHKYAASIMFSREGVESLDFEHSVEIVEASDDAFAHKAAYHFGKVNPPNEEDGWEIVNVKVKKIERKKSKKAV